MITFYKVRLNTIVSYTDDFVNRGLLNQGSTVLFYLI